MDPVTLILSALSLGAAAGVQAAASATIKDTYQGLKTLIQRKLIDKPEGELILAKHTEKPNTWELPLKETLIEVGADKDEEIIKAAQRVMTLVNPQQAAIGKFNVQVAGDVQGFVQGDNTQVTMTFGDKTIKE